MLSGSSGCPSFLTSPRHPDSRVLGFHRGGAQSYCGELAMRSEPSQVRPKENRRRSPAGPRRSKARAAAHRRVALESLEPRTLLATLPAPVVTTLRDISNSGGDESSP